MRSWSTLEMLNLKQRLGVTALTSAIEDTGLVIWLAMLHANPVLFGILLAAATLFTFLTVEHLIAQDASAGKLTKRSILEVLGFTALEVVNWGVWLALIAINPALAAAYFLGSFFVEHQITFNTKKGLPYLNFIENGSLRRDIVIETVSEFVGAAIWITLGPIGIIALVTGSSIEHFVASAQ
jgi:hypothetical protein